ncbi:glycoside hydrolase [Daedaleopsis nitida]|nr:glycoside hydrolase [Daedaleopsis nitida]
MRSSFLLRSLALAATLAFANAGALKVSRQASQPKYVVAHHIVGLTAAYTVDDWMEDISLAQQNGIDGFALNVGNDPYTPQQVENAYQAAEGLGSDFKLFISFDMSPGCFPCQTADDASRLRDLTLHYATRPNQLQVDSKAFVSSFSGETCDFGHGGDVPGGWRAEFTQHEGMAGRMHFVPSFFVDPATFTQYAGVMDGNFNWNSGWPITLTTSAAPSLLPGVDLNNIDAVARRALQKYIGSFDGDAGYIAKLADVPGSAHTYMAAVSPWFFTHFGADTYNKNWVYDADEHLLAARWEALIAHRDAVDLVQILTWNDFGESSYLGPKRATQPLPPGAARWVDGFDHTGWLALTKHYAAHFKSGVEPAVEKDVLVMWARPHPKNARVAGDADPVGPPRDFELLQDRIWAVVLATGDAQLTLASGDADGAAQTFDVRAGVNKFSLPLEASGHGFMRGVLVRDGQTVVELHPEGFVFDPHPSAYNYNAFVASATAA